MVQRPWPEGGRKGLDLQRWRCTGGLEVGGEARRWLPAAVQQLLRSCGARGGCSIVLICRSRRDLQSEDLVPGSTLQTLQSRPPADPSCRSTDVKRPVACLAASRMPDCHSVILCTTSEVCGAWPLLSSNRTPPFMAQNLLQHQPKPQPMQSFVGKATHLQLPPFMDHTDQPDSQLGQRLLACCPELLGLGAAQHCTAQENRVSADVLGGGTGLGLVVNGCAEGGCWGSCLYCWARVEPGLGLPACPHPNAAEFDLLRLLDDIRHPMLLLLQF